MKVLVLGAWAVGGYFGGRLAEHGVDVTFLVREQRKRQLAAEGLRIHSIHGDIHFYPKLITAGEAAEPYDLILLSTKAYHFEDAISSISPYIGEETLLLPLLNGIAHIEKLQQRFGPKHVLGGLCLIETTLNEAGDVVQTSPVHDVVYGEWLGGRSARTEAIQRLFEGVQAGFRLSENIQQEMWHKYLLITTLSGITTLLQASVGPIRETAYGMELTQQLAEEAAQVMRAAGAPIASDIISRQMQMFAKQRYDMKASMLRDMEKGLPVEVDHLQGYLLSKADEYGVAAPLLRAVYTNLKAYEIKRTQQQ